MDYLVTAPEMAEMDRRTIGELAIPGRVLMETAGRAVADACLGRLRPGGRVTVACGPGNNGGDGYVTARILAQAGHQVHVFVFAERARVKGDAAATLDALEKTPGVPVAHVGDARGLADFAAAVAASDLVVDALLGVGLTTEVRGMLGDAIDAVNEAGRPVMAVDIPSGVEATTGAVLGRAIEAAATVTFAFAKRGHYLFPGAGRRGELVVADIGIPARLAGELDVAARVVTPHDLPRLVPPRRPDSHKGTFGTVVVVAGSPDTPGAALLSSRGALRSGAGLVRWATDRQTLASVRALPPDLMLLLRDDGETTERFVERILELATAVVLGPGLSTAPGRLELVQTLIARSRVPLLVDADGLNLVARDLSVLGAAQAPVVVTPHPKELSRLTGQSVQEIQSDRCAAALGLATRSRCTVVLKGAGTVVADPDGQVAVAAAGNAGLAAGGTGDVLSGIVGGLLAQGLEPAAAARAGVLAHGAAGDLVAGRLGQAGLVASDLPDALGEVWARYGR